ncbi:MAG: hypothetical protein Cons2KO_17450 [Congregibacter sp.]
MNDDVVHELQAELAFQGQTIQTLNDALSIQQQDLLRLQRQLALVAEQVKSLREQSPGAPSAAAEEKPPHY